VTHAETVLDGVELPTSVTDLDTCGVISTRILLASFCLGSNLVQRETAQHVPA
jgi:hypothetical protein